MRDIAEIATRIAGADDPQIELRSYMVEFVMSLAGAIDPSSPDEMEIVQWLRKELLKVAKQIGEKK